MTEVCLFSSYIVPDDLRTDIKPNLIPVSYRITYTSFKVCNSNKMPRYDLFGNTK